MSDFGLDPERLANSGGSLIIAKSFTSPNLGDQDQEESLNVRLNQFSNDQQIYAHLTPSPCANKKFRFTDQSRIENLSSDALDGLIFILSAIYSKLIVIIGLCFPMAEVISHRIPIGWYEGFYLYLYLGSIIFLILIYIFRKTNRSKVSVVQRFKILLLWTNLDKNNETKFESSSTECSINEEDISNSAHFGSFYLRLGAVAFGIGSMIYSGLEFGQYFELESKEQCYSFLYGFTPTVHMIFTFFQLYFIFMNSRAFVSTHRYIGKYLLLFLFYLLITSNH
jgi:hypothetical protein